MLQVSSLHLFTPSGRKNREGVPGGGRRQIWDDGVIERAGAEEIQLAL